MMDEIDKAKAALDDGRPVDCIEILNAFLNLNGSSIADMDKMRAFSLLSTAHSTIGARHEAADYLRKALAALERVKDSRSKKLEAYLLWKLSFELLLIHNLEAAREAARKAVHTARELLESDPEILARALYLLSSVSLEAGDLKSAKETILEAKEIWENEGNLEQAATCMGNLADIYKQIGDATESIRWHERAVAMRRLLLDDEALALALGSLAEVRISMHQLKQGEHDLAEAVQLYDSLGRPGSPQIDSFFDTCRKQLKEIRQRLQYSGGKSHEQG